MPLTRYWILVDHMARMSLKAGASRYFLGYLWWILEPILFVAVFYVVFELLLQNQRENYLLFLICGKFTFIWFSKSVAQCAQSIVNGRGLIGRLDLPKSLFPMATIQEGLYKQAAVFALLMLIVVSLGHAVTASWWWLLPVIVTNYLLIVACALMAAFFVCVVFDFSMVVPLIVIFLLFMSGIFWDPRALPDPATTELVFALNPLAFLIDAYRQILLAGVAPAGGHLLAIAAGSSLLIGIMLWLMRRYSQYLALRALTL